MCGSCVLAIAFPAATPQPSFFHTLLSFFEEVTPDKSGIPGDQCDVFFGMFNAMVVASYEEYFDEQYMPLEQITIVAISAYLQHSWLPMKPKRVPLFKSRNFMLGDHMTIITLKYLV
jgi:hypothetical protein